MNAIPAQLEIRLQHPKGWADCQTVIKRAFVINSKTDKSFLNKKFYENWCNLEIIDRRNYIITPIFGFTKISPFKRYNFLFKTPFVRVYDKNPFDRLKICPTLWMLQMDFRFCLNGVLYPIQYEVFLLLRWERLISEV